MLSCHRITLADSHEHARLPDDPPVIKTLQEFGNSVGYTDRAVDHYVRCLEEWWRAGVCTDEGKTPATVASWKRFRSNPRWRGAQPASWTHVRNFDAALTAVLDYAARANGAWRLSATLSLEWHSHALPAVLRVAPQRQLQLQVRFRRRPGARAACWRAIGGVVAEVPLLVFALSLTARVSVYVHLLTCHSPSPAHRQAHCSCDRWTRPRSRPRFGLVRGRGRGRGMPA